jgi:tRNA 2-selenouridine synthase
VLSAKDFLAEQSAPIIDVRTPAEFEKGHIPGAQNLPLFSNDERHEVGLCYRHKGKDEAVKLGLSFIGPRLQQMVLDAEGISEERNVRLYCWRGGMRSNSLSWLLQTAGFKTSVLEGGYKAWRKYGRDMFETPWKLLCMGGFTGCSKTTILMLLQEKGEQMIDLEGLANHKGSSFGYLGAQPSTEHFENLLAEALLKLDPSKPIWLEDESKIIGSVSIPAVVKTAMNTAPFIFIQRSLEERIEELCSGYGDETISELKKAFERIQKRLGGQDTKDALQFLEEGNLPDACRIALHYYDKAYAHSLAKSERTPDIELDITNTALDQVADKLIEWKKQG